MEVPPKILFALSKITNECLGEEGTMGCHPFSLMFKNVLFFIYCTGQNTKKYLPKNVLSSHKNTKKYSSMVWQHNGLFQKKTKQGRG